jgi:hypothetical protein
VHTSCLALPCRRFWFLRGKLVVGQLKLRGERPLGDFALFERLEDSLLRAGQPAIQDDEHGVRGSLVGAGEEIMAVTDSDDHLSVEAQEALQRWAGAHGMSISFDER